jgi:hypothetical protein
VLVSDRQIAYVALDELIPAERNPKRHRTDLLRSSIDRFGFATPALRDERTGRLVVGHGRTKTLASMHAAGESPPDGVRVDQAGRWLVPVVTGWASRSDAEADAYLVADNRHSELGGWDHPDLADMLGDLAAADADLVDLAGWDRDELADLLKAASPVDLDGLAGGLGEPGDDDMWMTVKVRCAPHLAAGWREHLSLHGGKDNEAFAALLQLDANLTAETWAG